MIEPALASQPVLVCGGGAPNANLMMRLRRRLVPRILESTDAAGIPPAWVEAFAFDRLATQTPEGKSGNLPSVTGTKRAVVPGGIYQTRETTDEQR